MNIRTFSLVLFGMFLLIGVLGGVSAEKMRDLINWDVPNDLYVGGVCYSD